MPAIKPRMWSEALRTMPRLDLEQWRQLHPVTRWLIACRAPVLAMTLSAAALGGLLAWRAGAFDLLPWMLAAIGLLLAHATNNLLNDYTDSRRGIDRGNYYRKQYGVHVLEDGLMTPAQLRLWLGLTGGAAIAAGLWLVAMRGGLTLNLMLAGAFFALFYTWPLKYFGLGEPAVLVVWGPLMVGGTYYVTAGHWSWDTCWISLVFALGPTAVLMGKHTDKAADDRALGVRTLPVLLGDGISRQLTRTLLGAQYLLCVLLVLTGRFGWPLLLVMVALPRLAQTWSQLARPRPEERPADYPEALWPLWFSAAAFGHTRLFGGLFVLALLLEGVLAA